MQTELRNSPLQECEAAVENTVSNSVLQFANRSRQIAARFRLSAARFQRDDNWRGIKTKHGQWPKPSLTNCGRVLTNCGRVLTNCGRMLTNCGRMLTNCGRALSCENKIMQPRAWMTRYLQGCKLPGSIISKVRSIWACHSLDELSPWFNICRVAGLQGRLKTPLIVEKVHFLWACRSLDQL